MDILYLSASYIPSRRASSVQVMKMCGALARQGHRVTLVAKRSAEPTGSDDFEFFGVEPTFSIQKVARPPRRGGGVVFAAGVMAQLARHRRVDLVYGRDIIGAYAAARLGLPVVLEAHALPGSSLAERLWRGVIGSARFRGVVAISDALARDLSEHGYAPADRLVVAHDAADPPSPTTAVRDRLGTPPRIGYVGNLYPGRGIELIVELARRMPSCQFDVVGGNERDLLRLRQHALPSNLALLGFHPPGQLAGLYREMDVVLMPYPRSGISGPTGGQDTSRWASPMKMFEYMASGAPIVSSDLPVLQEVLVDGENALIVEAGRADAWQRAIERLLDDAALRQRLAGNALADLASRYTWDARARHVLNSITEA